MTDNLYKSESILENGLHPILNQEIGQDLITSIEKDEFIYDKTLLFFLENAPFLQGYWNSFKKLYKVLESELKQDVKRIEEKTIISSLSVIFNRLESHKEILFKELKSKETWSLYRPRKNKEIIIRYSPKTIVIPEVDKDWEEQGEAGVKASFSKGVPINTNVLSIKLSNYPGAKKAEVFPLRNTDGENVLAAVVQLISQKTIDKKEFLEFINTSAVKPKIIIFDYPSYFEYNALNRRKNRHLIKWQNDFYADLRPFLLNTVPSQKTILYLKRRSRRLLRYLQESKPDVFISLSISFFKLIDEKKQKRINKNWLLSEILFGSNLSQKKHGRGDLMIPNETLISPKRHEPCKDHWEKRFSEVANLLEKGHQNLHINDTLSKIYNSCCETKDKKLDLTTPALNSYLQSSSLNLIKLSLDHLFIHKEKIRLIQPASFARALIFLDPKDSLNAVQQFINENKVWDSWKERFIYELDDAIYSYYLKNNLRVDEKLLILCLFLFSLKWPGRRSINSSEVDESKRKEEDVFSYSSKIEPRISSNISWHCPNTSANEKGLLGWSSSVAQKIFLRLDDEEVSLLLKGIKDSSNELSEVFQMISPSRLLDLLQIKHMTWNCDCVMEREDVRFSPKKVIYPKELLGSPADHRLNEKCKTCGQSKTERNFYMNDLVESAPQWVDNLLFTIFCKIANKNSLSSSQKKRISDFLCKKILNDFNFLCQSLESETNLVSSDIYLRSIIGLDSDQWKQIQKNYDLEFLNNKDFLTAAWNLLGDPKENEISKKTIILRIFKNKNLEKAIEESLKGENLLSPSNYQVEVFLQFFGKKENLLKEDSTLLIKACTSSNSRLNGFALSFAKKEGLNLNLSLSLIESKLPKCVQVSTSYFKDLDPGSVEHEESILALCDSSNEEAQTLGLELIESNKKIINFSKILKFLCENNNDLIKNYLATQLSNFKELAPEAIDFDISILRNRNKLRKAKEHVKKKIQNNKGSYKNSRLRDAIDELSSGQIKKDKTWAINFLTHMHDSGEEIPHLTVKRLKEEVNANS